MLEILSNVKMETLMFKGVNILYRNVLRLRLMRNAIITTLWKKPALCTYWMRKEGTTCDLQPADVAFLDT